MAIITGVISKLSGSVGSLTFARLGDVTVVREKIERKRTSRRTWRQMRRRVLWSNLVNLYRAFGGTLHPSFEDRAANRSDFNEFMSVNIGGQGVALTAEEARQGACVVAPYQLTRGSLPGVLVSIDSSHQVVTDISLGSLTIGSSTTLQAFSTALLENNEAWADGDQLSVYVAVQEVDGVSGMPRVSLKAYEVTLDVNDGETLIEDIVGANLLGVQDGMLKLNSTLIGGVAVVHSRKERGVTKVSSQRFVVDNPTLAQYQIAGAVNAAVLSYGDVVQDDFLTPNIDIPMADTVNP